MMSAPSALRRTACARPCPRAAPVISATLPESDWFIGLLSSFRLVAHDLVEWVGAFEHAVGFLAFSPVSHAGLLQCGEAGNLFPEGLHRVHVVVVMTRHPRPGREPGEPGGRHCTRRDEVAMNPSCWDVVVQTVPDEHSAKRSLDLALPDRRKERSHDGNRCRRGSSANQPVG